MEGHAEFASAGLAGLAGLHVAWALGSSWPLPDKATLSDAVIGHDKFPPPAACLAVAGALAAASSFVAGGPARAERAQRAGTVVVVTVLSLRGALGLAGLTRLVSPRSSSPRFRGLDRRSTRPSASRSPRSRRQRRDDVRSQAEAYKASYFGHGRVATPPSCPFSDMRVGLTSAGAL
jgi:Protein of unknown function (DUF3995)